MAWAQQWGGAGVKYDITIKKNGVTVQTDTAFLSQNGSYYTQQVTTVPCTLFINFTSTGNFNLNLYTPGTLLTGSPVKTMPYTGGAGYMDVAVPLTVTGAYDLKVIANPANPSGGWSSFTYYSGSMSCNTC